jgi:protein disulfide-isomerase
MRFARGCACLLISLLAGCEMNAEPAAQPQAETPVVAVEPAPPSVAHGMLRFSQDVQQGLVEAGNTGKPLLLFFTAEWCHFCHQMAAEAFTDPQVVSLSERFVCVLVDADRQSGICQQFQVSAYPTVQFISPQGILLNRIEGNRPGHQVTMAMQTALQNSALRNQQNAATLR